ncbi:MAG: class I fructose-bisphosphate aldolase [Candidatus Paceibacterota bacterium]
MNTEELYTTAKAMMTPGKGILAADESNNSAAKRLEAIGAEASEENRMLYRDLFFSANGIENYLSGTILYDETIRQANREGKLFRDVLKEKGIIIGIKVDTGAKDFPYFPGEKITYGLDGLAERLKEYYDMGARFAKWRAVITIGDNIPTEGCIRANAHALARYAGLCQEANIVPMVEPEVLLEGNHTIEQAEQVTTRTIQVLFEELVNYRVDLKAVILKTSMVVPGSENGHTDPKTVAEKTVAMLKATVPAEVPGVVFLSGGQTPEDATAHLNEMAKLEPLPWQLAFSYARAIQGPALEIWQGKMENFSSAQEEFINRLKINTQADQGKL